MNNDELNLIIELMARIKRGVGVINGRPHIHGVPATWDNETPLLDCLSQWRCPHCRSNLSLEGFVCLNACHLTVPEYREFQENIKEATARVERRQTIRDGFMKSQNDDDDLYGSSDDPSWYDLSYDLILVPLTLDFPAEWHDDDSERIKQRVTIVRAQSFQGRWNLVKLSHTKPGRWNDYFVAFELEDDAAILKLSLI